MQLLYLGDDYCRTLSDLQNIISKNPVVGSSLATELLCALKDGTLYRWLMIGGEVEQEIAGRLPNYCDYNDDSKLLEDLSLCFGRQYSVPDINIDVSLAFDHVEILDDFSSKFIDNGSVLNIDSKNNLDFKAVFNVKKRIGLDLSFGMSIFRNNRLLLKKEVRKNLNNSQDLLCVDFSIDISSIEISGDIRICLYIEGYHIPITQMWYTFLKRDWIFDINGVQFKMVRVEGGEFMMGATAEQGDDAWDNEKPKHKVSLDSFYIGETQVTQALWKAVMGNNPSNWKGDNLPVEDISWNDSQEFIRKINQLTGRTFALPTEAQWEYAARGGKNSKGYKYAGSNNLSEVAWFGDVRTYPVAQKKPNELGLYDMSGNVWEWCNDWYDSGYYQSSPQHNPQGPISGDRRVMRGGCWLDFALYCRVSHRINCDPDYHGNSRGIRLFLSV